MEQIKLTFTIPISVNQAYAGMTRRYKSKQYKEWEKIFKHEYNNQTKYWITDDDWLQAEYNYYMPIYNKNGTKKVKDVANYEKILTDALCKVIEGLEDHKIKSIKLEKHDSDRNEVEVLIKKV